MSTASDSQDVGELPMARNPILPYAWMLSGSFAFALMGALAHVSAPHCDWQVIALARSLLAFVFAAFLALFAGVPLVLLGPRTLWMRSIAGSCSLVCTFFALTRLPVSDVLTLTNMFPIWVALLAWPMMGERPTWHVWLSIVSGLVGVVLIQNPQVDKGNFAAWVALASSFTTAVAMLGLHRLQHIDPRAIVAHFSGVSSLFCVAAWFVFPRAEEAKPILNAQVLLLLLGVGCSATIGQLFLTKAFAAGPPAKVAVVCLTQVVFAMGFDVLLEDGSFTLAKLAGVTLVVAPSAWLMIRRARAE